MSGKSAEFFSSCRLCESQNHTGTRMSRNFVVPVTIIVCTPKEILLTRYRDPRLGNEDFLRADLREASSVPSIYLRL